MRRVRFDMESNSFDRERKPPCLPKKMPSPKVPKQGSSSVRSAIVVFPRSVFEAVAPPNPSQGPRAWDRDREVIYSWLRQFLFHEYTDCFLRAGYDLPTIAVMSPEDLVAIGVRHPAHVSHLKQHIDALVLPDALPRYVPSTIEKWLRLLRLDEYLPVLVEQGFRTVPHVAVLSSCRELEVLGIVRLGHQKRLLLAIGRIKDITSGRLAGYSVSEEEAEPQCIEYVTVSWRSVSSVTHQLPPPDGPYNACTSFSGSVPPPEGAYGLLAHLGGRKAEEVAASTADEAASSNAQEAPSTKAEETASSNTEDGAAAVAVPSPQEIHESSELDNIEGMLAALVKELDVLYNKQMDNEE